MNAEGASPSKPAPKKGGKKAAGGEAAAAGATPAAKRPKTAAAAALASAAGDDEHQQPQYQEAALNMKGQLTRDLAVMLYGFGDDAAPLPETLDLVEDIVLEYATTLMHKAMDSAAQRGKLRRPGAPGCGAAVGPEDIMFLVRKDPRKYARAKELLIMDEEIKKARQTVEDVGAQL